MAGLAPLACGVSLCFPLPNVFCENRVTPAALFAENSLNSHGPRFTFLAAWSYVIVRVLLLVRCVSQFLDP